MRVSSLEIALENNLISVGLVEMEGPQPKNCLKKTQNSRVIPGKSVVNSSRFGQSRGLPCGCRERPRRPYKAPRRIRT